MANPSDIRSAKLFTHDPRYARANALAYFAASDHPSRGALQLIVLGEAPKERRESDDALEEIASAAIAACRKATGVTPEHILESILEVLNDLIPELARRRGETWFQELNLLVGVAEHGQLHFSHTGSMAALLSQGAVLTNVAEEPSDESPTVFSHITSGLLTSGDSMLLCTPTLIDYVAEEKLRRLMTGYPPAVIVEYLESLLAEAPRYVTFSAVIIKCITERDLLSIRPAVERTAATYAPTETASEPTPSRRMRTTRRRFASRIVASLGVLASLFLLFAKALAKGFGELFRLILKPATRAEREEALLAGADVLIKRFSSDLKTLPKRTRYVLGAASVLLLILLNILVIQSATVATDRAAEHYNETLAEVSRLRQASDNAVIYDDEAAAEQYLIRIEQTLRSLKPRNQTQRDQLNAYLEETVADLNRLRRVNPIANPLVAWNLSPSTQAPISAFAVQNDTAFIASEATVYRMTSGGAPEAVGTADGTVLRLFATDQGVIAHATTGSLYQVTNDGLAPIVYEPAAQQKSIRDAAWYSGNLYTLDNETESIYKYTRAGATLRSATVWRSDDPGLGSGSGVAVDGSIYVVSEGAIKKYTRGEPDIYTHRALAPALGNKARIALLPEGNLLVIADPDNQRVSIMKKDGVLIDQFSSDQFSAITDIALNPSEDTLWVSAGSSIFALAIQR